MLLICALTVIIATSLAQEEGAIRVNKPRNRVPLYQTRFQSTTMDNVRCFCNLPTCVGTGYLCKSNSGCFSDIPEAKSEAGRHGCMEFLPSTQKSICLSKKGHLQAATNSLLVCCATDLCNHVDNPNAKKLLNNTLLANESINKHQQHNQEELLYSNSEVWFRVATIVVPICGAVILFVLVGLAVKILKKENQNSIHNKLNATMYIVPPEQKHKLNSPKYNRFACKIPYYSPAFAIKPEEQFQGHTQIPLLVTNNIREANATSVDSAKDMKNHTNAKLDYKPCEVSCGGALIIEIEKDSVDIVNNPNILQNSHNKTYEDKKTFLS